MAYTLYVAGRRLTHDSGRGVRLSPAEMDVLLKVLESSPRPGVVPQEFDKAVKTRVAICRLRKRLESRALSIPFRAVIGRGYSLTEEIKVVHP